MVNRKQFENLISQICNEKIELRKQVVAGKWYEQVYSNEFIEIEENTIYGVVIDNIIDYEIKLGVVDYFIKTFITQYINKKLSKTYTGEFKDGGLVQLGKDGAKKLLRNRLSHLKLGYKTLYVTNYGIGQWVILESRKNIDEVESEIRNTLSSQNIEYKNEYSDAFWVYRYKINKTRLEHINILNQLNHV